MPWKRPHGGRPNSVNNDLTPPSVAPSTAGVAQAVRQGLRPLDPQVRPSAARRGALPPPAPVPPVGGPAVPEPPCLQSTGALSSQCSLDESLPTLHRGSA